MTNRIRRPFLSLAAAMVVANCGSDEEPVEAAERQVPVTQWVLEESSPALPGNIMGVVAPLREEQVGFEVGGRVVFVRELGQELEGPTRNGEGEILPGMEGAIIGSLDPTRHEQALEAATLRLASARKGLEAQQIEVDTVAVAAIDQAIAQESAAAQDVKAAEASLRLAQAQYERMKNLLESRTVSQAEMDEATATFDNSTAALAAAREAFAANEAQVATAKANLALKKARIEQSKAEIRELVQAVTQSQTDLADCVVHAPYSGRITERHVGTGGYVSPGQPVVTLTMLDYVKVLVTVSAEQSRRILPGGQAALKPTDLDQFTSEPVVHGWIYAKSEVADPSTHTFRVDVALRNLRRGADEGNGTTLADRIFPVLKDKEGQPGPIFVQTACIVQEDGQDYVYRLPGVKVGPQATGDFSRTFEPERVPVQRTDHFRMFVDFPFVEVVSDELSEFELLLVNPAVNQRETVRLENRDWLLRPGDLVPVQFDWGSFPPGFYVPVEAVRTLNDRTQVFVIEDGRCRAVNVSVHESSGQQRRIEGPGLTNGTAIVVEGIHYLEDGAAVRVVPRAPWRAVGAAE